jgi:glycosyltransferase involved in cell wall biosynthesis
VKILVFSDVPPTHALTAGLVLDRLAHFLPPDSMVSFAALNRHVDAPRPADLHWLPSYYTIKPIEEGPERFRRWPWLRDLWAAGVETYRRRVLGGRILRKAIWFGRHHEVDAVLAVLQGQTMIHLAAPLAKGLGAPLYTLVWDPFSWWCRGHGVDVHTARLGHARFDATIKASEACAVASWAMAEHYEKRYGVRSVPVIASHEAKVGRSPPPVLHDPARVVIGMAGQFYASSEWDQLMIALDCAGWQVGGKPVFIRTMGGAPPPSSIPPARLEYLGWKAQPEMVAALSECDILYCPYPFTEAMSEVSQLSFPSKLVAYFAAGRPAIFHGPLDSSPARYITEREAGLCVGTAFASSIYNAVERVVCEPDLFRRLAENGQRAFRDDFTLESMRRNFYDFLGIPDAGLDYAEDQADAPTSDILDDRFGPLPSGSGPDASRPTLRGWVRQLYRRIPQIARLHERIAELESRVAELSAWNAINAQELSAFYAYTAKTAAELGRLQQELEAAQAGKPRGQAAKTPKGTLVDG